MATNHYRKDSTMETTTSLYLSSTGTTATTSVRSDYHTYAVDTAVIPNDNDEFIVYVDRAYYDKAWNRDESLCDSAQVTVSREHAEVLLKILQDALAK